MSCDLEGIKMRPRQSEIPTVHYHDISNCTPDEVIHSHLYSSRGLATTFPNDIILLHPLLEPEWTSICDHYSRIGLTHTKQVVWDTAFTILADYPECELSPFFFDESLHAYHPDQDWLQTTKYINSKNNFMGLAHKLGVPTPLTLCFKDKTEVINLSQFPYPCYAKAAISISGLSIYRCENSDDLQTALPLFEEGVPIQIQQEINTTTFLNLQYHIDHGELQRYACSEQVLEGFRHMGNRYPVDYEPWEVVEPLANWLFEQGMKGVFAFDVGVEVKDGKTQYLAIECNPRFNGATYPSAVACKLQLKQWLAEHIETRHRKLSDIDLTDIEYNPETKVGIVLVNWGTICEGKLGVLIAGDAEQIKVLSAELHRRLD